MKKILFALLGSMLFVTPALADTAIGMVNVAKILHDSKAATSIRAQVQAKQKDFQAQLDSKGKELQSEQQALVKQKDAIDKDAFNKKVQEFRQKEATAQKNVQEKSVQLDKSVNDALGEVQKVINDIVKDVATEKKMTLVVSAGIVLYGDSSLDITDEVLKRLDSKLTTVPVKF
ncbi:MAG: OmpH family outer membrane protein [Rickettsiales bacterium]